MIKIYENSMNSSQSFKAGLHKLQHTSLAHPLMRMAVFMCSFTLPACPQAAGQACSHTYGAESQEQACVSRDQLEDFWV